MKKDFNEFRFKGLDFKSQSNKYFTMNRISDDETKIVVNVGDSHVIPTRYGYAFVIGYHDVIFLKDWQVSKNYFGTEIILDKNYFNVRTWGNFECDFFFENEEEMKTFDYWLNTAKLQAEHQVLWKK